jgi:hypothetical protein
VHDVAVAVGDVAAVKVEHDAPAPVVRVAERVRTLGRRLFLLTIFAIVVVVTLFLLIGRAHVHVTVVTVARVGVGGGGGGVGDKRGVANVHEAARLHERQQRRRRRHQPSGLVLVLLVQFRVLRIRS